MLCGSDVLGPESIAINNHCFHSYEAHILARTQERGKGRERERKGSREGGREGERISQITNLSYLKSYITFQVVIKLGHRQ